MDLSKATKVLPLSKSLAGLKRSRSKKRLTEEDVGKLKMGKSVISLLTTTSMYSEFNKFGLRDDLNEDDEDSDDGDNVDLSESARDELLQKMNNLAVYDALNSTTAAATAAVASTAAEASISAGMASPETVSPREDFSTQDKDLARDVSLPDSPLQKSLVRSLESKRQAICGALSSRSVLSNKNIVSRATALCRKLIDTFGISSFDELIADYSCWLLRDVLLQGHLYITKHYILFFAYLPSHSVIPLASSEPPIVMSGALLVRRRSVTSSFQRYWAVLRGSTLCCYSSSTDLYFPLITVDLHSVIRAEVVKEDGKVVDAEALSALHRKGVVPPNATKRHKIRVVTDTSSYLFYCDTLILASEWVSKMRTQMFALKSTDDKVTIRIPLRTVVDLETDIIFENAESIRLKVLEDSVTYALDDYFFLFFNSANSALENISSALSQVESSSIDEDELSVLDNYRLSEITETQDKQVQPSVLARLPSQALRALAPFHPRSIVQRLQNGLEMWLSCPTHYQETNALERGSEDKYAASPEETEAAVSRFRTHFSLPDLERLVATYYAYLQRNVPVYGKVYLGLSKLCFRSLVPAVSTKMVLPFLDVETCYKERSFSFGYSGMVVVITGHEELFFEFSTNESRDDCECLVLRQLDRFRQPTQEQLAESIRLSDSASLDQAADIRRHHLAVAGSPVPVVVKDVVVALPLAKPCKMKVTCLTIGLRGDVQPYIALCQELMRDGHETTIATHGEFKEFVESYGIQFREVAGSPTALMLFMGGHSALSVTFIRDARAIFAAWIDELLDSAWKACQGADLLIESPSAMAGIHIAEALKIPYFRAFTMPWTRTRAYPHAFIVPELKRGGSFNYFTHVMFENVFWKGILGQVNRWRQEKLGLPKTDLYQMQQNRVPFLYNVSPVVLPPSVDFSGWISVTGYWFVKETIEYHNKELEDFIEDSHRKGFKVVYIGFGSIVVSDPKELTGAIVGAVEKAGVRCVLNKGWSNRLEGSRELEMELPGSIFNAGSVPHLWLFSRMDAAVHHGGSGTTGASLAAGLPTVVKPFFGDQFFYAHRVEDLGVGVHVKKLNQNSLAKAIKEVTTDSRIIEKAKAVGEKIRAENGARVAVDRIYEGLEYAKGLVEEREGKKMEVDEIMDIDQDLRDDDREVVKKEGKDRKKGIRRPRRRSRRKSNSSWLLV